MKKITYYAPSSRMGDDVTPDNCGEFRTWAETQLTNEYPDYEISVLDEVSLDGAWTSDTEHEEEIKLFAARLWDCCPWDWLPAE